MVKECLLRLLIKSCLKNILIYGNKFSNLVDSKLYNTTHFEDKEKGIRYINSKKAVLMVK